MLDGDDDDDDQSNEAARWILLLLEDCDELIRPDHVGPDGVTVAELFALRNGDPTVAVTTAHPVGQYL
jgi:hypothetical protein